MAYVTVEQLSAALQDAGGAGARNASSLPDVRLQEAVDEATAEVTGRLAARFTLPDPGLDPAVPVEGIPDLLRSLIINVAVYLATLEFNGSLPLEPRDPVQLRYDRALALLGAVSAGKFTIDGLDVIGRTVVTGDAEIFQPGPSTGLAEVFAEQPYTGRHNTPAYGWGSAWE